MIELVVFVLMAAAALAGALTLVLAKNPVYSALGMLATPLAGLIGAALTLLLLIALSGSMARPAIKVPPQKKAVRHNLI